MQQVTLSETSNVYVHLNLQNVIFGHHGSLISYNNKSDDAKHQAELWILCQADGSFMNEWIQWCFYYCGMKQGAIANERCIPAPHATRVLYKGTFCYTKLN